MSVAYIALSVDFIHPGHLRIIEKARTLGDIVVGLLTDEAIATYKRVPTLEFQQRKEIVENIKGVKEVIAQKTLDYTENLEKVKPDFVVHGDDWVSGPQKTIRDKVLDTLAQWGGELVELPYSHGFSARDLNEKVNQETNTPDIRRSRLRRLISAKDIVKILEVHSGLTGLIAEKTKVLEEGIEREFDGMWISSLTDSTAKGKPDIELVDITSRLNTINDVLEVTTKPIILDGDTGGRTEHFSYLVKTLERLGVSAVIIEDKKGLKKNSLFGTDVLQHQESIEAFCQKISIGKKAQATKDFMIIARIESLILEMGQDDAMKRARSYVEAGADGIMIHSKSTKVDEIKEFVLTFRKLDANTPIIVVPTTYNYIKEEDLANLGVNVVIYANHLLRSAYPAMKTTAELILKFHRSLEVNDQCLPIKEILNLIPGGK